MTTNAVSNKLSKKLIFILLLGSFMLNLFRTETSTETIAVNGDPTDGFAFDQRWHMALFLPGRSWFSAGQGWNNNSRNGSAGPLRVVPLSFSSLQRLQNKISAYRNHSVPIFFWKIWLTTQVERADKTCKTHACMKPNSFYFRKSDILHRKKSINSSALRKILTKIDCNMKNFEKNPSLFYCLFWCF